MPRLVSYDRAQMVKTDARPHILPAADAFP